MPPPSAEVTFITACYGNIDLILQHPYERDVMPTPVRLWETGCETKGTECEEKVKGR